MSRQADLDRIERALSEAARVLDRFTPGEIDVERKAGGDPVTEADEAVDDVLRSVLPVEGEGWLSEETADDPARLRRERVWIVDPLDGTKEFIKGIPEWSVSIGLVERGRPVAGGVLNPLTDERVVGSLETGVRLNGRPCRASAVGDLFEASILASRSEIGRGEWERFSHFRVEPCGSVAYKLARVAAGTADATWTLVPKHEWDVAAGVALVRAAGGTAFGPLGETHQFNNSNILLPGLVACAPALEAPIRRLLDIGAGSR